MRLCRESEWMTILGGGGDALGGLGPTQSIVSTGYCTHSQFTMHASNDPMNDDDSVSDEEDDDVDAVLLLKGCLLHKQSVWEGVWSSSLYNIMYGVVLPCMVW